MKSIATAGFATGPETETRKYKTVGKSRKTVFGQKGCCAGSWKWIEKQLYRHDD